jgi:hypothetical protein
MFLGFLIRIAKSPSQTNLGIPIFGGFQCPASCCDAASVSNSLSSISVVAPLDSLRVRAKSIRAPE